MIISFFEEFPTKQNLEKIKLINFPTKLYIASNSAKEFNKIKKSIKKKNIKEIIYWSVLKEKEGYWFSPWTKRTALLKTIKDVKENKAKVMWDAEFPRNRLLFLTQLPFFFFNKILIKKFFKEYGKNIYTAEYLLDKGITKHFLKFFTLTFNPIKYNNHVIKMIYTSTNNYSIKFIENKISYFKKRFKDKFIVALGVLTFGINGNEAIITPKNLERDLKICKNHKIKEVIIFRLGGLNKEYLKVIKKFI